MPVETYGKNFRRRLCRFVEEQLRAPFEIIQLTGIHASSLFILAHRIQRIVQSLVKLAQQTMSLRIVGDCKCFSDFLASPREVSLGSVSQSYLVLLARLGH